ncbi:hypothetical protein GCM10008013_26580 [Paenibacillus segetis]|uniref:Uncharacterized protein n=1 Tax=Paenibacillus segetis TaxID=1325360 RepID=A0ABQ1YJ41_9BACL|nr:hypothetical protein GCM10008013_26580 [Paenibacillus segetis]
MIRNIKLSRHCRQEWVVYIRMVLVMGCVSVTLLLISGCSLSPDSETLQRQSKTLIDTSPSVSDGVYAPTIIGDVYSKE